MDDFEAGWLLELDSKSEKELSRPLARGVSSNWKEVLVHTLPVCMETVI